MNGMCLKETDFVIESPSGERKRSRSPDENGNDNEKKQKTED
jgi:hypothetical protein